MEDIKASLKNLALSWVEDLKLFTLQEIKVKAMPGWNSLGITESFDFTNVSATTTIPIKNTTPPSIEKTTIMVNTHAPRLGRQGVLHLKLH